MRASGWASLLTCRLTLLDPDLHRLGARGAVHRTRHHHDAAKLHVVCLPSRPAPRATHRKLYSPQARQEYLEQTYPSTAPQKPAGKDKPASAPRLNLRNTIIKALLDQTIGAALNTLAFSLSMNALAQSMTPLKSETELLDLRLAGQSLDFLLSGGAVDAGRVDWENVVAQSVEDFWPLMMSGWSFWPAVSLVNFAFVREVGTRNLVGGLAGVAWGMYMSGFAAR